VLGFIWLLLFSFENCPLRLFPVFGKVALLLFGLAQPFEGIVVLGHISLSGASPFVIEVALLGATSIRVGGLGQVNLPAGATRANENIPTPHHRAETILEEQSTASSFHTSSPSSAMQIGDQTRMYANTR
jgi:hypothetical protein